MSKKNKKVLYECPHEGLIAKKLIVDFVSEELRIQKRDNYLLGIKIHRRFSDLHCNEPGDIEYYYMKDLGEDWRELKRNY